MTNTIEVGTRIKRRHITEVQTVRLIGPRNVVIENEIGVFHTCSKTSLLEDYMVVDA